MKLGELNPNEREIHIYIAAIRIWRALEEIDPRVGAAYHLEHWGSGNLHASMKHNMVLGSAVPTEVAGPRQACV
jgi:hypothetical protein